MVNPSKGGGFDDDTFEDLKIDLRDRLVVWYRVIYNRPAEVIAVTRLPKTIKKVKECWKENVENNDVKYEDATFLIPEYQDLVKEYKEKSNANANTKASAESRNETSRKITSYNIYTAIVERETINVLTLHFGIPKQLFAELFDLQKADEVKSVIYKRLKGNPVY